MTFWGRVLALSAAITMSVVAVAGAPILGYQVEQWRIERANRSDPRLVSSHDGFEALIDLARRCDGLCHGGVVLRFVRDGRGDWHLHDGLRFWVSDTTHMALAR